MCPPVQEGLENYLAGKPDANLVRHLGECAECREVVVQFTAQSETIRSLRVEAEVEPPAGFYARVMERIEAQRGNSIWNVFLEPLFGRRLMYASAVLTVLLGIFLFTSPKEDTTAYTMPERILAEEVPPAAQMVDLEADRNAVFVQLTTFQE